MRSPRRRGRRVGSFVILVLVAVALWAGGLLGFADAMPRSVADAEARTDAIVVLTGGSGRVATGLDLLGRDRAQALFVSGVYRGVEVRHLLKALAADAGDLESRIHLGTATNTQENAAETAVWAATRGVTSIRLVTGGYHMPRSLLEFRGAMPDVELVPHPVFPDHVKLAKWWAYPGTLALTASEYTKFVAAWLRLRLERAITVLTGPSAKAGPS